MMALVCDWQGDLTVGPSGDLNVASVPAELQQRIIRRLLTSPGEYIWHLDYGAGLGNFVGDPSSSISIEGVILDQLQQEWLVSSLPPPVVLTGRVSASSLYTTNVT